MTDLVEAARYSSRVEADLARLYLESEGLDAVLVDAEINSFYGGLFMPVRLRRGIITTTAAGTARAF